MVVVETEGSQMDKITREVVLVGTERSQTNHITKGMVMMGGRGLANRPHD